MPERAFGRTDDFLTNGEHAAQKFLFATLVNAGKTILFEPDGIVRQRGRGFRSAPKQSSGARDVDPRGARDS